MKKERRQYLYLRTPLELSIQNAISDLEFYGDLKHPSLKEAYKLLEEARNHVSDYVDEKLQGLT